MSKFVHPIQSMRRCPNRFSIGAALLGSLWAYSEGMRVVGGRLYVLDAAISLLAVFIYAYVAARIDGTVGLVVSMMLYAIARIVIGLNAPSYLRQHLVSLGYKPHP